MSDLFNLITSTFPANSDVGVPLLSNITITLSGLDYSSSSLTEGMFIEGPDTDQFVGPGQIDLLFPDNISQGDLDDFLESPGYQGIVQGTTTVSGISGNTVLTFNPTLPLAALTVYTVNLTGVQTAALVDIAGFVTFSFTAGSGSIETIPSTVSSSVLSVALPEATDPTSAFKVTTTTPTDHSVENSIEVREIDIEFNKAIDATTVDASDIQVKTIPATNHPNAQVESAGDLAKSITVDGNKITIKI